MLFSISNAFKKLNWKKQNFTHIVLNLMIVFQSELHFPMFLANFDQSAIWSADTCYVLRVLSKNIFDPYCPIKTQIKFLTNLI